MSTLTRADLAVLEGLELVGIVRDYGVDTIESWVRRRQRTDLEAIVVALAAMVPDDKTPAELLRWLDPDRLSRNARTRAREARRKAAVVRAGAPIDRVFQPCGTHAAFNRHRSRGEDPCGVCIAGERIYQRLRARDRRPKGA